MPLLFLNFHFFNKFFFHIQLINKKKKNKILDEIEELQEEELKQSRNRDHKTLVQHAFNITY